MVIFLSLAAEFNPEKVLIFRMNILYQTQSYLFSIFLMQNLGVHEIEMGRLDPRPFNAIDKLLLANIYLELCI